MAGDDTRPVLIGFSPPFPGASLFDTCHVGVVLRAVLLTQAVTGVAALHAMGGALDWLMRFALLTAGVLSATLAWLIAACLLKAWLNRLPTPMQWLLGTSLMAAMVMAWLVWRARALMPAATTARLAESQSQSRIRPHFLFNTLNSAIALVRAEPAQAEAVLEDLAELFRSALADLAESVTRGQEIILAQRYLAIEQVRLGERLRVKWQLDAAADGARLPPLLLQPLCEHASGAAQAVADSFFMTPSPVNQAHGSATVWAQGLAL